MRSDDGVARTSVAASAVSMDSLASGLITMANGLLTMLGAIASPLALALFVMGVSLTWLALIEIDELDRQGAKPEVGTH